MDRHIAKVYLCVRDIYIYTLYIYIYRVYSSIAFYIVELQPRLGAPCAEVVAVLESSQLTHFSVNMYIYKDIDIVLYIIIMYVLIF